MPVPIWQLRRLYKLLDPPMRVRLVRAGVLSALSGPVELIGLAAFLPMVNVLSSGSETGQAPMLPFVREMSVESAAVILAAGVLFRGAFVGFVQVDQFRTTWAAQSSLSSRLLSSLMSQDFSVFSSTNTDELSSVVISETEAVASRVVLPYLTMASALSSSALIVCALVTIQPMLAMLAFGMVLAAYGLTSALTKARSSKYAVERVNLNAQRFNTVAETLEAYEELRTRTRREPLVEEYRAKATEYGRLMAWSLAIGAAPRYAVEAAVFLSVAVYVLIASGTPRQGILAALGIFALGAYRLLPSVQVLYHGVQNLRFGAESLRHVEEWLPDWSEEEEEDEDKERARSTRVASIRNAAETCVLALDRVSFTYPGEWEPALHDLTLRIRPAMVLGITGPSGSGKSTLLEIVAGLRTPTSGSVRLGPYDIHRLHQEVWAEVCAYVPQKPRLFSGSLERNIAVGHGDISRAEMSSLIQLAALDDRRASTAVNRAIASGAIGQDGSQLSGGQRQRIGIARALHQRPSVLLLDESTSALDARTEERVLGNLKDQGITVVLVAHRHSALRMCDEVLHVEPKQ